MATQEYCEWTPEQLAYLAGLVDGEGCLSISYRAKDNAFKPCLSIGMATPIVWQLRIEYGVGKVYYRAPQKKGWKPTYIWDITRVDLVLLLPALIPYLKLKRPQAELLLQFLEISGFKYRGQFQAKKEAIWKRLRKLNMKGA